MISDEDVKNAVKEMGEARKHAPWCNMHSCDGCRRKRNAEKAVDEIAKRLAE